MEFDHIHIYVEDAIVSRNWFIDKFGFEEILQNINDHDHTITIANGPIYILLSSPRHPQSPVANFLRQHPPGIADIAFRVDNLSQTIDRAISGGAKLLQPVQTYHHAIASSQWAIISGWGSLQHSLIEVKTISPYKWLPGCQYPIKLKRSPIHLTAIDHVVLNVEVGDMNVAANWYNSVLGLNPEQSFNIQTDYSGLYSQVMTSPQGKIKFPINEPASPNSQIQEFLNFNRGSGIQHIALTTTNIIETVSFLKNQDLQFLSIPETYYDTIEGRGAAYRLQQDWEPVKKNQILVDWNPSNSASMLLQIFTNPIFNQPTFFWELIERRQSAEGFGEGNFKALFEAIERQQIQRS
ncbi:MAG: 4-hydroxyphenylpyruvate dioxygenase [Arthrospira sp. PLM2.Bin9]|nr:4-hydroxyphenylpyruvate dioxygenase [Arthrospira sp. PLM2.Bin9]TVU54314.1 MAG: 4-hydroxyphenylpyruvate dioxygenase [Arthrospira sp. PLM2.Bin9]